MKELFALVDALQKAPYQPQPLLKYQEAEQRLLSFKEGLIKRGKTDHTMTDTLCGEYRRLLLQVYSLDQGTEKNAREYLRVIEDLLQQLQSARMFQVVKSIAEDKDLSPITRGCVVGRLDRWKNGDDAKVLATLIAFLEDAALQSSAARIILENPNYMDRLEKDARAKFVEVALRDRGNLINYGEDPVRALLTRGWISDDEYAAWLERKVKDKRLGVRTRERYLAELIKFRGSSAGTEELQEALTARWRESVVWMTREIRRTPHLGVAEDLLDSLRKNKAVKKDELKAMEDLVARRRAASREPGSESINARRLARLEAQIRTAEMSVEAKREMLQEEAKRWHLPTNEVNRLGKLLDQMGVGTSSAKP